MNLNHNETEFFSTWSLDDPRAKDIKTALTEINKKLNNITRDVSFWDVYNVTQVLLSDNDLTSKLALLNIGEAAIVNANVLNNGAENHYRGDIAYRKADGELIWIDAENKGIYKPSVTYENGMLQVTYSYQSNTPEEGESQTVAMETSQQQGYLIDERTDTFLGPVSGLYTCTFNGITCTFNGINTSTGLLKPLIKFLIVENGAYEEIYPDYTWTYTTATVTNEDNSTTTIYRITVSTVIHSQNVYMRVR